MGRKPCCEKVGLRRGPWTTEEDRKLVSYVTSNGICCWRAIPKLAGLLRCGKSCRLRWTNYLRPDLKRGIFTEEEENLILELHASLGNRWSRIAAQLAGRTDNEIKNYWNTRLKKRLRSQGLDPATHLPLGSSNPSNGTGDDSDSPEGEDGDSSSDARGPKPEPRNATKEAEPAKPVRQPRGPKPAPQLKMCQSDEGPVLLIKAPKTSKPPTSVIKPETASCKCDEDSDLSPSPSSSSTVTTKFSDEDQSTLASAPSFPEAELWKCIKATAAPLSTTTFLDEWDSYFNLMSSHSTTTLAKSGGAISSGKLAPQDFTSQPASQDCGGVFLGTCFPQPGMDNSWSMDVEMCPPTPESLFAPNPMAVNPAGIFSKELQRQGSYDLQKLAALLDLI